MIARKFLIPLRKEYFKIRRTGRWFRTPFFDLIICSNNLGYGRFAFVVSTKVSNLSVTRHKIKRLLSGICQGLKIDKDLVFIAKREIVDANKAKIENEINRLISN